MNNITPIEALPTKFLVKIGGYIGESFQCELVGNKFVYTAFTYGYAYPNESIIEVSDKDWHEFMVSVIQLGLHEWEEEVIDDFYADMMDGTSWSVEIKTNNHHIYSHASNAYPKNFAGFLEVMHTLLKGKAFY